MKRFLLLLAAAVFMPQVNAQQFVVDNGMVERMVDLSDGHVTSGYYKLKSTGKNFLNGKSNEFSFTVNDSLYTGQSNWTGFEVKDTSAADGMTGKSVSFSDPSGIMSVRIDYLTYPDIAVIRKFLTVRNTGASDFRVENVDVENLVLALQATESWSMHNYARDVEFGPYRGNWNDPLVVIHEPYSRSGVAVGNEAIATLKRVETFSQGYILRCGLNLSTDSFPFRRWLAPGEQWTSPAVFTALYDNCRNPQWIVDNDVQKLIRLHMGTQVEKRPSKPMFVYNTWRPFRKELDEKLILDVARSAAQCGVSEFVIDDGWQINVCKDGKGKIFADWGIDTVKFPRGLGPVFDTIRKLGMKPGLWISIAQTYGNGHACHYHPEWSVLDAEGKRTNIHGYYTDPTACMGTDWSDYICDIILSYVRDYGLAYVKLDLAIATSAYIYDDSKSGCYATNHKYHRDHADSYAVIFDRCMAMFDRLHEEAPELFIDCTFETAGKLQLMDYGISRHADGNWLSNVESLPPDGSLRVRNLAWRRTPALSAASLVIGNLDMNGKGHMLNFKSLAGTFPIMLGDPRELSQQEKDEYRQWSGWLSGVEARHGFMSFRQDLPGFGEPRAGSWDGFMRINTDTKSGGLVGVFREQAAEKSRTVTVTGLDPDAVYSVRKAPSGDEVMSATGAQLAKEGFPVTIEAEVDGELFEIIRK